MVVRLGNLNASSVGSIVPCYNIRNLVLYWVYYKYLYVRRIRTYIVQGKTTSRATTHQLRLERASQGLTVFMLDILVA